MNQNLTKIFSKLKIEGERFYIADDGRIMSKGFPTDSYTGIFKDEDGRFYKSGLTNTYLGIYQNEDGEFKENDFLSDSDTGIYQNENGQFIEKGFVDSPTGFRQDKHGEIKGPFEKEVRKPQQSPQPEYFNSNGDEKDGFTLGLTAFFYIFLFCVAIAVIYFAVTVSMFLAPLIGFAFYFYKKRTSNIPLIVTTLVSAYMTYDVSSIGYISNGIFPIHQMFSESQINLIILYFVSSIIISGLLYAETYSSKKIETDYEYGNFFTNKEPSERRVYFYSLGGVLIILSFLFLKFTGKSNSNSNINYVQIEIGVNIRDKDNSSGAKIGSIEPLTQVELIEKGNIETVNGKEDYWYKIRATDGVVGYIFGAFTNLKQNGIINNPQENEIPNTLTNENEIIQEEETEPSELQVKQPEITNDVVQEPINNIASTNSTVQKIIPPEISSKERGEEMIIMPNSTFGKANFFVFVKTVENLPYEERKKTLNDIVNLLGTLDIKPRLIPSSTENNFFMKFILKNRNIQMPSSSNIYYCRLTYDFSVDIYLNDPIQYQKNNSETNIIMEGYGKTEEQAFINTQEKLIKRLNSRISKWVFNDTK